MYVVWKVHTMAHSDLSFINSAKLGQSQAVMLSSSSQESQFSHTKLFLLCMHIREDLLAIRNLRQVGSCRDAQNCLCFPCHLGLQLVKNLKKLSIIKIHKFARVIILLLVSKNLIINNPLYPVVTNNKILSASKLITKSIFQLDIGRKKSWPISYPFNQKVRNILPTDTVKIKDCSLNKTANEYLLEFKLFGRK